MKKRIILTTLVILIAVAGFLAWKFLGATVKIKDMDKPYLYIKTGATHDDVKKELLAGEFLKSTRWYDMVASLMKYKKVNPGRYKLRPNMSLMDLVKMLRSGSQNPVSFTITKFRLKETLAGRIGKNFETDSLQMITFLNSPDSLKKYDVDTNTVMIIPMPLTYPIKWNSTPSAIFEHFYTAYKNFWTDERKSQAQNKGLTPVQASIVASIIDEETNAGKEKGTIASVYLNRINTGIPLQADPTLKFAVKDFGLTRVGGEIMKAESPYNTYINRGLPPGPICTPQLATIDSVLTTPKTDYLYFVASTDFDGTHMFTTNLTDHGRLAREYHKELNKRKILLKPKTAGK
jgi:UPF0755 protein